MTLFCPRPRGKRRSVHRTMPTSKRKTLIPREIRHYLRLRPEIGQQDLDERSKHLTERGPFVNGARSNLAAAHGRGLHPTGAPINVAVSRFAFCPGDHWAARLKLHVPASSCRTDLIKQGRASAGRSWSHSDSRMAAAASSPPCVAPVDPLLMTARNMDAHQASWDHTPRRQR